jgi:hypothetical protein
MVFINKGKGNFDYLSNQQSGMILKGDVREIKTIGSTTNTSLLVGSVGKPIQSFVIKK